MRSILFNNGTEVKRANYPREDMAPIENLDSNLEWLVIEEDSLPNYDSRTHDLVTTETRTTTPHSTYPHLNVFTIEYSTSQKANVDIEENVKAVEDAVNEKAFEYRERLKVLIVSLYVLIREKNGQSVPPQYTALVDAVENKIGDMALNIIGNHNNLQGKLDDIANSILPDLDTGWSNTP